MKILIVDDEEAIHDQLKACIPTEDLGWEIAGDAYNGEEACRMVEQFKPDIVITDIKMPLLDGLNFMEWLKKRDFSGKVIVLSGYGDFQYSRPAFLLDAFDYLLKPLQEAELIRTLSKAVEELKTHSNRIVEQLNEKAVLNQGIVLMRDELLSQIAAGRIKDEIDIYVRAEQLSLVLPESKYYVMVITMLDLDELIQERYRGDRSIFYYAARNILEEISQNQRGTVFRNLQKAGEYVVICETKGAFFDPVKWARTVHSSAASFLRAKTLIGVSSQKQRVDAVAAAYEEGVKALETIRYGGEERIARFDEQLGRTEKQGITKEWKELQALLDCFADTGALDSEASLPAKLEETLQSTGDMSLHDYKQAVLTLVDSIARVSHPSEQIAEQVRETRAAVQEWNVRKVNTLLRSLMAELHKHAANHQKSKSGKQLIHSIKQYVEENYQTVNLETVSQRFYLNKNYFCSLFKSATGENFSEYLTRVRMEQAKLLLAGSGLTTYEIAEMVGYQDYRYFGKVFRKTTGMLPKEYRNRQHART
jgi:two-component system response regulator YesN